jgi:predicted enzyme related to lactoylglutathione lyase
MKLAYARIVTDDVPRLSHFYETLLGVAPNGNERYAVFATLGGQLAISSKHTMDLHGAGAAQAAANRSMVPDFEVPDADAEFARVRGLGVEVVMEPRNQPWGNRSSMFRDPDGNLLNIYSPIRSTPQASNGDTHVNA